MISVPFPLWKMLLLYIEQLLYFAVSKIASDLLERLMISKASQKWVSAFRAIQYFILFVSKILIKAKGYFPFIGRVREDDNRYSCFSLLYSTHSESSYEWKAAGNVTNVCIFYVQSQLTRTLFWTDMSGSVCSRKGTAKQTCEKRKETVGSNFHSYLSRLEEAPG